MPDRHVLVYRISDGRWTWRVVEEGDKIENGPAYPTRREAVTAAASPSKTSTGMPSRGR